MSDVVVTLVIPSIGLLFLLFMYAAPMQSVLEARARGTTGEVNPFPFVITAVVSLGWIGYGLMVKDYFITIGNIAGVTLSLFYLMSVFPMVPLDVRGKLERILLLGLMFWGTWSVIVIIAMNGSPLGLQCIGYTCAILAVVYYSAGLTALPTILKERDASSLNMTVVLGNTMTATIWAAYGIAGLESPIVYIPNLFGIGLSFIQFMVWMILPSNKAKLAKCGGDIEMGTPNDLTSKKVSEEEGVVSMDKIIREL
jgi:solute carrier family 50 protein (sugar transporter)